MKLPPYTKQQENIIYYLYQFRYLLINQLIKLFGHNDKKWMQQLLNNLVKNKYIDQIKNEEVAKGYIYCLDTKARHILKKGENIDQVFLGRLYKEKKKETPFIKRHLFLATISLYFISQKKKGEELNFFTYQELSGFEYFPDPKPLAYIEVVDKKETLRYFLEFFDEYTPNFAPRERIKYYLEYAKSGEWQSNTDNAPLPSIIFILPTDNIKKHIQIYSQEVFKKNLGDDIDLFLTTKNEIKTGQVNWEEITVEEE